MTQLFDRTCRIESVGYKGDGLSRMDDKMIAIPFVLKGETVRIRHDQTFQTIQLIEVCEKSDERIQPACPHFTVCGGCHVQHMSEHHYSQFKRDLVVSALNKQGLGDLNVDTPIILPRQSRRRAAFKAFKQHQSLNLGFYQRNSHTIVNLKACPLMAKPIEQFLSTLRPFLQSFLQDQQAVEIFVTLSDTGLDVLFSFKKLQEITLEIRTQLIDFARASDVARFSILSSMSQEREPETLVTFRRPIVHFDGIPVEIEAKSFLQASKLMDQIVADYLISVVKRPIKRVADLFCGRGTLALPLSSCVKVDAYDVEVSALRALQEAAHQHHRPIQTFQRNLFHDPLPAHHLNTYDCVSINPPREGALKQVKALAQSNIPQIFMMSCNPISFAREARILREQGYTTPRVTPVDQFLWSPHIEVMAYFHK